MGWSMIIVMLLIKQKNNDRKERYQQSRYVISSETIATSIRFSPAAAVSCRLLIVAGSQSLINGIWDKITYDAFNVWQEEISTSRTRE